jgi:hypothetical protein
MKTKAAANTKKQNVALKDLKTKKNPKGGALIVKAPTSSPRGNLPDLDANANAVAISR